MVEIMVMVENVTMMITSFSGGVDYGNPTGRLSASRSRKPPAKSWVQVNGGFLCLNHFLMLGEWEDGHGGRSTALGVVCGTA